MHKLFELLKKYDYLVVFVVLVAVSVVLMVRTTYYHSSRIMAWSGAVTGRWYKGVNDVVGYFGLREENDRLAAENAQLRAQLAESYIDFVDTVIVVNDTVYRQRYSYTEAKVLKNSWNGMDNYIIVGKGSEQGIKIDQAVISPEGMVGVVTNVSRHFSMVMPVLHSDSRNSVKVKRTGISGSLVWDGADYRYAQVVDVPTTHQFIEGDTIVTSGMGGDFPEGVMVGYVVEAENLKGSGFYKVRIRLATDFNKLSHVYIVDNHFRDEMQQLDRTKKSSQAQGQNKERR